MRRTLFWILHKIMDMIVSRPIFVSLTSPIVLFMYVLIQFLFIITIIVSLYLLARVALAAILK